MKLHLRAWLAGVVGLHRRHTGTVISRDDLLRYVATIEEWCRLLGDGARGYMGYEGFDESFKKPERKVMVGVETASKSASQPRFSQKIPVNLDLNLKEERDFAKRRVSRDVYYT